MTVFTKRVLIFVASLGLFAFIAWTAGYNFDTRNEFVAFWVSISIVMSLIIANAIPVKD